MTRTILIDTDTASDDAVALIMALRSPAVHVAAITTVAGNVPVDQATRNALYTAELCASDVPIYTGAAKPLLRPLETATWFHGVDGLGDHGFAPTSRTASPIHAVDALIATIHANPGIELITLGPLTNLALALSRDPSILPHIGHCVVMGGAPCCEGNVTPAAEFNIWVDPEAARIVFRSGLPIELIGWQLSRFDAVLNPADIAQIEALATPFADFTLRSNSAAQAAYETQTGEVGISLPDPIAMAILLDPTLNLTSTYHHVEIETASELTRGMTVVDRLSVATDERNRTLWSETTRHAAPAEICWKLDIHGWKSSLISVLS